MIRRLFKWAAIGIVSLVVVVPSCALLYREYLQHQLTKERAITSATGIDSLEPVRIGGIDQWIHVRGQNVNNPILLLIHGGPGAAFIPLAASFQGEWETYFTVVEWDQRGAGKTYASNDRELQRRTMQVQQMQQDTLDVANYLRNRFHRKKIFVLGHSWGSVLGLWLAHEHPDLLYAYVGVAQVVNPKQNDEVAYRDALQEARSSHNAQAVKELERVAPSPHQDSRKGQTRQNWQATLLGPKSNGVAFLDGRRLVTSLASAPEYSLADVFAFVRGQLFSLEVLLPQTRNVDLAQLGSDFRVPLVFLQGRHDSYTRPSLIWAYYQTITAPQREFIWFDNSGHFPFFEEKQKFADELVQRVLPLATDREDGNSGVFEPASIGLNGDVAANRSRRWLTLHRPAGELDCDNRARRGIDDRCHPRAAVRENSTLSVRSSPPDRSRSRESRASVIPNRRKPCRRSPAPRATASRRRCRSSVRRSRTPPGTG